MYWENVPVRDIVTNAQIQCTGMWNSPVNVGQFNSAISKLHQIHGHKGAKYEEKCVDCYSLFQIDPQTPGCRFHLYSPRLWRRGMPSTDAEVTRVNREAAEETKCYVQTSNAALTPADLVILRTHLLSTNQLEDLMFYTIFLLMIKLFLRSDEVLNPKWCDSWGKQRGLTDKSFDADLNIVSEEGIVDQLGIYVFGKKDETPKLLTLYADKSHIEFCPIKHLPLYIYCSGWKSGPLFPSIQELQNLPQSGVFETFLPYCELNDKLQNLCENLLRRPGPFGTHTCRRTGYLFGIWGGASWQSLMNSARHKDTVTAMRYAQDAEYLWNLAKRTNCMYANSTEKFQPVFLRDKGAAISIVDYDERVKRFFNLYM